MAEQEKSFPKLTAIIGGTSEKGMDAARGILRAQGSVALFDSEVGDSVTILAAEKPIDTRKPAGGILFQEIRSPQDRLSVATALGRTEDHFGRQPDVIINLSGADFVTPVHIPVLLLAEEFISLRVPINV